MEFVVVDPYYEKACSTDEIDPGWPEYVEWTSCFIKGDPRQHDLTELFAESVREGIEEKVKEYYREP